MGKIKKIILFLFISIIIIFTFLYQYTSLIRELENTAKNKEAQINKYIDLSSGLIDLVALYGNDFFKYGIDEKPDLYSYLQYDPSTDTYNLDTIEGTEHQEVSGNLTGMGKIPDTGICRREIDLALYLNRDFNSIYNEIPGAAWIYYTSSNNFINIYPWISSKDFSFDKTLQAEKFYTCVTPENDPLRKSVWTPVYLDHAGKGLMVTLTSPIYSGNTFLGAVSIDFTNNMLSEIIESPYDAYIIDETDSVIAGTNIKFENKMIKFESFLQGSQNELQKLKELRDNEITILGKYFVYSISFPHAPWKMYFRVPILAIVSSALLFALPITVICLLLLIAISEIEKRKATETQLKDSLKELTSYQTLLENAAKYDFLTGTVNRRGLFDIFNKNIETQREKIDSVVFIMGDIDLFKQFNDTYGHAAGDKILKEIAAIMQKYVSRDDVVCRWGGEEFVIMLLGRTFEEGLLIAEKIRKEIEETVITWDNSIVLHATMTFGVAEHDRSNNMESSISKADAALYIGKSNQRNQVVGFRQPVS